MNIKLEAKHTMLLGHALNNVMYIEADLTSGSEM